MPQIRFLKDQVFETGGRNKGPRFSEGTVLGVNGVSKALGEKVTPDYALGFLTRWVNRGVAVWCDEVRKAEPVKADEAEDK